MLIIARAILAITPRSFDDLAHHAKASPRMVVKSKFKSCTPHLPKIPSTITNKHLTPSRTES